jgi:hypothetical protein
MPDPVDHRQGNVDELPLLINYGEAVDLVRNKILLTILTTLNLGKYIGFSICE